MSIKVKIQKIIRSYLLYFSRSMNTNAAQVKCARDTLIKTIYAGLYDWIVQQLNNTLHPGCLDDMNYVGILDMPGFG